jgi:hypothetical protein
MILLYRKIEALPLWARQVKVKGGFTLLPQAKMRIFPFIFHAAKLCV